MSKLERHLRDARHVEKELREIGEVFKADAIARLRRSASASRETNRRLSKDLRDALKLISDMAATETVVVGAGGVGTATTGGNGGKGA
jgi:hypothetical protein